MNISDEEKDGGLDDLSSVNSEQDGSMNKSPSKSSLKDISKDGKDKSLFDG